MRPVIQLQIYNNELNFKINQYNNVEKSNISQLIVVFIYFYLFYY